MTTFFKNTHFYKPKNAGTSTALIKVLMDLIKVLMRKEN